MKKAHVIACLFTITLSTLFCPEVFAESVNPENNPSRDIIFCHVNVIDITKGIALSDMAVVISGEKITVVEKMGEIDNPKNALAIDATGKFLIPGLWDMHVHWYETKYLPIFIANGVTGIRLMSGAQKHFNWRKDIEAGKLIGPRVVIASPIVDGPNPLWPGSIIVTNQKQARQTVQEMKSKGADFIKVYTKLSKEAYFALADECSKEDFIFAGHVPYSVTVYEASKAGQRSLEHMTDIIRGFSKQEAALCQKLLQVRRSYDSVFEKALDTFDDTKASSLCQTLLNNNTWLCPTLIYHNRYFLCHNKSMYTDPRLEYIPSFLCEEWKHKHEMRLKLYTKKRKSLSEKIFQKTLTTAGFLKKSGLGHLVLAGTDTGNPHCIPGFSLHDELELLVQSGFTPAEALKTSTYNAARFLDQESLIGTIEEGKLADLVLLEANPLEDIRNTTKIITVVFNGKLYSISELKEMKEKIKNLAQK
jgi:hypothetical protein